MADVVLTPELVAEIWANAFAEGWLDLRRLRFRVPAPPCCRLRCGALSRYIDPDGVGWCGRHKNSGLHPLPDFETVQWRDRG